MIGIAAAIRVVAANCRLALVVNEGIQHMQRFAGRWRNQLGEIRTKPAREVRVKLEPGSQAVMGIALSCVTAQARRLVKLAIG